MKLQACKKKFEKEYGKLQEMSERYQELYHPDPAKEAAPPREAPWLKDFLAKIDVNQKMINRAKDLELAMLTHTPEYKRLLKKIDSDQARLFMFLLNKMKKNLSDGLKELEDAA